MSMEEFEVFSKQIPGLASEDIAYCIRRWFWGDPQELVYRMIDEVICPQSPFFIKAVTRVISGLEKCFPAKAVSARQDFKTLFGVDYIEHHAFVDAVLQQ